MSERGFRQKSDINKAGWETAEAPILCETCLGENPYIRMTREPAGAACKVCSRPFTVFRWRPGPRARFKQTEVCQMCAKVKNVCQTCVLDLTYGLPVQVRDAFLAQAAKSHQLTTMAVPDSEVGRSYQAQQHESMLASGENPYGQQALHQGLLRLARKDPAYRRNLPKLCSFFAKGECNRGKECPYRHEMPNNDSSMSKQNIVDRFHGRNDPVAARMLQRASGKAEYHPPPDTGIRTLWLGPLAVGVTEDAIRAKFAPHGEVASVRVVAGKNCAFVEYATQPQAIAAFKAHCTTLQFSGASCRVDWAHTAPSPAATGAGAAAGSAEAVAAQAPLVHAMPPPPGLRPGMALPPPPAGVKGYSGFVPPPPPKKKKGAKGGPVRRGRTPYAEQAAHPYASMDPSAMGSRVRST